MMGLTERELQALEFVRAYLASHGGVGPNLREIADGLGLQSKSGVCRLLAGLESKMVIRRLPHRARAIEITEASSSPLDFLPADLRRRIEVYCRQTGDSPSGFIIDGIALHLDAIEDVDTTEARRQ